MTQTYVWDDISGNPYVFTVHEYPLDLNDLDAAPGICIFARKDQTGYRALYIGQMADFNKQLTKDHHRIDSFSEQKVTHVHFLAEHNKELRDIIEQDLIESYELPMNSNHGVPSNMIITPTDDDTSYLACFDWEPAFGSHNGAPDDPPEPMGTGATEIDAMVDLYNKAMQYPEWCAKHLDRFESMILDNCAPDVRERHSGMIGFIAGMRAMQPNDSVPVP